MKIASPAACLVAVGAAALLAACAPAPSAPVLPAPVTSPVTAPAPPPDTVAGEACQVSQGGGVYYLAIESPPTGDLSACDGNPRVPGGAARVIAQPGLVRRCIIPAGAFSAAVTVYSDAAHADRIAAASRCRIFAGRT